MKLMHKALLVGALIGSASWPLLAADDATAANNPQAAPAQAAPAENSEAAAENKDLVLTGDAKCTKCHDEADEPKLLAIGKTRHGVTSDKRNPTCTGCHGASEEHIAKAGRAGQPSPKVEVGYTAKNPATAEQRNEKCLSCHQGARRIGWQLNAHATRDVDCSGCHKIHDGHDKVRDKTAQTEVCFACHKEQRAQVNRPSHHPVVEGKMGCSSCHDPHGDNPKALIKASTNETCYTCHMEKRGPFVHNHQPVTEDCGICHNPHGSSNQSLLKARAPFLCEQCHNDSTHRSQPGVLPTARASQGSSNMGAVARGCLNCHTNIHGGNSTQNDTTAGRFRR